MRFYLAAANIAFVALPAMAEDAPATSSPDKKVCKTITPTGSIMGKRICLTKAEWQQFSDIAERNAEQGLNGRKITIQPSQGD